MNRLIVVREDAPDREFDVSMNFWYVQGDARTSEMFLGGLSSPRSYPCRCWLVMLPCTFGVVPFKSTLVLESDSVTKTDDNVCGRNVSRRTYAELGSVDRSTCCCFVSAESGMGSVSPDWGCRLEKVDEIVVELKDRVVAQGNTSQLLTVQRTLDRLDAMEHKVVRLTWGAYGCRASRHDLYSPTQRSSQDMLLDHLATPTKITIDDR